jgi:DNA mismatch repair protein MutS
LVIEKYNSAVQFIPNDLSLSETAVIGNIIYGVNSSGRSSFLKAVGLAVIMAQAGLFVAAESMQFKPVKRILTRICGMDDIEKGHSSFIVELNEIRSILLKSDHESLSLCDELSKGTETDSAEALNYTLFENLSKRNSKFVTTTHLHNIADDLDKIDNIKIFHMKVLFDHDGLVIFERKLHPGPGPHLYGLEIARNMNFPPEFIEKTMEYRNSKKTIRKSRYNSKHIVSTCENCKYRPQNEIEIPVEVHHINFQCNAESYGLPIHNMSNLVSLCRKCHTLLHQGNLKMIVQQTLKGRKFIFEEI